MEIMRDNMKKIILFFVLVLCFCSGTQAFCSENFNLSEIGFHKKTDIAPQIQIRNIFENYQKYTNSHNLDKFLNLHDSSYRSSDGYDRERLKELAQESWKEYPDVKYSVKVLSVDVDVDNATVITKETLSGTTHTAVEFVKGTGYIDSESTAIYYLRRCSNEWKIISDFVVSEKTSMRYGMAKFIPMSLDAPAIVAPEEEYTAILKMNVPRSYLALVSIANEPITYPLQKSTDVFRNLKNTGIQERILKSNNGSKNENAVASIGIAKPDIKDNNINVNIVGVAFLSSRVNVVKHKIDNIAPLTEKSVDAQITKEADSKK